MRRNLSRILLLLAIIVLGLGAYLYLRPVPVPEPVSQTPQPPKTTAVNLPWPASGQAAIGAVGYGVLATHSAGSPLPIASITKIITAMAVLKQKPITDGSQGPTITLDSTDVGYYDYYLTNDGSVAKVTAGEQITEYQALQAMLLPSANNMADSLARWAFGSIDAYLTYAKQMVAQMGLNDTTVGSTNGFANATTSTASDLVKLGIEALSDPVIAQIVSQSSANIPVAGTVKNVNWLLGTDGVVGIKTGNTNVAGGCYLFAADHTISGQAVTLVGAVLGAPNLQTAISQAKPLLESADNGFTKVTVASKDQVLDKYQTAWGATVQARPSKNLSLLAWKGLDIKILNEPGSIDAPQNAGAIVGTVTASSGQQADTAKLVLSQAMPRPSIWWRIFHR